MNFSASKEQNYKLLILDERNLEIGSIADVLSCQYQTKVVASMEDAIKIAKIENPDLILLGVSEDKQKELLLCELFRNADHTRHVPIIMISSDDNPDIRIEAFSRGVDDFLVKPYSHKELMVRVRSKIRRIEESKKKDNVLVCGDLRMNLDKMEVLANGKAVYLSVLEFNLLKFFMEKHEQVLSRKKIIDNVWQGTIVSDRTVDTHIVSLRKKIENCNFVINTVYGAGYIFQPLLIN